MLNEAQIRYIEDVLGSSTDYFHPTSEVGSAPLTAVAVWTAPLSPSGRALLEKVLASVQLSEFQLSEHETQPPAAHHVLHFLGGEGLGRVQIGATVHWRLPSVEEMLGSGSVVIDKKKAAWALLQQFQREKNQ